MKKRKSSLELLRIIAMLMIITLHFIGPYTNLDKNSIKNYYILQLIESFSIIGVNIFIIISSFFLIDKEKIKLRKIIDLLVILIFYGLLFYTIAIVFKIKEFDFEELIYAIIPSFAGRRCFILSYIFLYLLSPYLAFTLNRINKNSYKKLVIITLLFTSIWPTFFPGGLRLDNGYGIVSFVVLFILTGYIKRFFDFNKINKNVYLIIGILSQVCIFILSILKITETYWNYNNIFNIIAALSLFLYFNNLNISCDFINKLSSYSFATFLIHSDFMMSTFFYEKIMKRPFVIQSKKILFYILIYSLLTYLVCSIIEIIRKILFKYSIDKLLAKINFFNKEVKCE